MPNPIKPSWQTEVIPVFLLTVSGLASNYFYNRFPAKVPTHWNIAGQVDGWSSPAFAAFFLPALFLAMYLLLLFVPMIDPKRERYEEFGRVYHIFKNSIVAFMVIVYFLTSFNGIGYNLPIGDIIPGMVGLLFILIGNYMGKLKLNWFVGARTPWTMSSETVWNKTNRLSGKLFMLGGLLMLSEIILPLTWKLPVLVTIVISISLVPIIYSYYLYSQEQKSKNTKI